jgi:hypothetical protein
VEAGWGRLDPPWRCTGFSRPLGADPAGKLDAADLGEQDARLPQRHGLPVPVLHLVHELEHVAGRLAAEAVVDPPLEVHRAAGLHVVVEGARDLQLIPFPSWRDAVMAEDGAEVRALAEIREVDTSVVSHGAAAI